MISVFQDVTLCSLKTFVSIYCTKCCHIPEDFILILL